MGLLSDTRKSFPKRQIVVLDPCSRLRAIVFFGEKKKLDLVEGSITDIPLDFNVIGDLKANSKVQSSKKKKLLEIGFKDIFKDSKKASLKIFLKKMQGKSLKTNSLISGSWISNLLIDSKEFWNPEIKKFSYNIVEDPIPSDVRFREDILWLRDQNFEQAQKWKLKLEAVMRNERKQRELFNKQRKVSKY